MVGPHSLAQQTMKTHTLVNTTAAAELAASGTLDYTADLSMRSERTGIVQAYVANENGDAKVTVFGTLDGGTNYVELHEFAKGTMTTAKAAVVTLFPKMKVTVTNTDSGNVLPAGWDISIFIGE
jgi:hypothetical protein